MKISFITTVFNEEKSIEELLHSIDDQTLVPDEVIIVDGGSTDKTAEKVLTFQKISKLKIKFLTAKGNRSVGRNTAISNSTGDLVLSSDAGCVLNKSWVKNITKPIKNAEVDVVAGYYDAKPETIFQKCLIPYVFVMPDKVDPNNFLPATRSMAFRKTVWEKLGGFDEKLSHNEDYAFSRKIKEEGFKIKFVRSAIVYWDPPTSLQRAFIMLLRFAYGDAEAGIYRPKALFVIARYLLALCLILFAFQSRSTFLAIFLLVCLFNYIFWAIAKNYHYVNDKRGILLLPVFQFVSDVAVIIGTIFGFLKRIGK